MRLGDGFGNGKPQAVMTIFCGSCLITVIEPFKKMLSFALDGITSFSVKPLQLILTGGFIFGIIVPIIMIIYALVQHAHAHTIPGWTSLLVSIWFIGGMIMMAIGITGIYIGKIYKEVKQRPRYFIEEDVNLK